MRRVSYEGKPLYVCERCSKDTFDPKVAREHEAIHPPKRRPRRKAK